MCPKVGKCCRMPRINFLPPQATTRTFEEIAQTISKACEKITLQQKKTWLNMRKKKAKTYFLKIHIFFKYTYTYTTWWHKIDSQYFLMI